MGETDVAFTFKVAPFCRERVLDALWRAGVDATEVPARSVVIVWDTGK